MNLAEGKIPYPSSWVKDVHGDRNTTYQKILEPDGTHNGREEYCVWSGYKLIFFVSGTFY